MMAKQNQSKSPAMQRVMAVSIVVAIASIHLVKATHHPLHCTKWHNNCQKYERNCRQGTASTADIPKSCCDIVHSYESSGDSSQQSNNTRGLASNIYSIKRGSYSTAAAYCDMTTDGGGWMVILRRSNPVESFERYYDDYEDGFGQLDHDFFYGLSAIRELTVQSRWELRVDFYDKPNDTESSAHADYNSFYLGSKEDGYALHLGTFSSSDIGLLDNLREFNEKRFVARRQGEGGARHKCVVTNNRGAWWYREDICQGNAGSILTLPYYNLGWYDRKIEDLHRTYGKYEMKIRQQNCLSVITL